MPRPANTGPTIVKTPDAQADREPRGARRKRETRLRLLEAAMQLMATRGMEGVAINEITEAADVGFGTFYNHFESKEAIYAAVIEWIFEDFGHALDKLAGDIQDPAEVISVCVRHTLQRSQREPLWGQFLIREGYSSHVLERGLGQRLLRDLRKGIASGRFNDDDPMMSFLSVVGILSASVSVWLNVRSAPGDQGSMIEQLGFNVDELPQRCARALMLSLGLPPAEAEEIAYRPLPAGGELPESLPASAAAASP